MADETVPLFELKLQVNNMRAKAFDRTNTQNNSILAPRNISSTDLSITGATDIFTHFLVFSRPPANFGLLAHILAH